MYVCHVDMFRRIDLFSYSLAILLLVWPPENFIVIKIKMIFVLLNFSIPFPDVEVPTKFLPSINRISQKYS